MRKSVPAILQYRRSGVSIVVVLALVVANIAATDAGDTAMYQWTDRNGVYHVTDDLSKVPPAYRSNNGPEPDAASAPVKQDRNATKDDANKIAALIQGLKKSETSAGAALKLGQLGDEQAIEPLIELLFRHGGQWERGREAALRALAKLGHPRGIKAMILVLDDENMASYARETLVKMQTQSVTDVLISTICNKQEDPYIISQAAWVFEAMGKRGVDPLISCLQINSCAGRSSAAYVLGQMRDARAVDSLIAILKEQAENKDGTMHLHEIAAQSLRVITGQKFGPDHRSWATWREQTGSVQAP
jgi:HEAT repeat protein